MPRPLRSQERPTQRVRRRHRTWVRAMIMATLAWGVLWTSLLLHKLLGLGPPVGVTYTVAALPAVVGVLYALMTVRAKRAWIFMAGVALFANGSLLAVPWLFDAEVRAIVEESAARE